MGLTWKSKNYYSTQNILSMKKIFVLPAIIFMSVSGNAQKWAKEYEHVNEIACGLSLVEKDGKHGYVDKDGKVIVPIMYDEGMNFVEGMAGVMVDHKWGYIDSTGKEIVKPQYSEVYSFNEGLAAVSQKDNWGFIDHNGNIAIPLQYTNARCFSSGLAPVCNNKNQWGYINKEGKVIIPFQYGYADRFRDGTAKVMKSSKWVYIDPSGKVVKEGDDQ